MDSKRILLVATFRLTDVNHTGKFIKAWKSDPSVKVLVLIESSEWASYPEDARLLLGLVDKVKTYTASRSNRLQASTKKSPYLTDVFQAMHEYSGYNYYAYVNADIEISPMHGCCDMEQSIKKLITKRAILFARRHDYLSNKRLAKPYDKGFDFFAMSSEALSLLTIPIKSREFQIGQVGWDYMLPLCIPKQMVVFTNEIPLYHKCHPTGSSEDWGRAMASFLPYIHKTWLYGKPIQKTIVYLCCMMLKIRDADSIPFIKNIWASEILVYLASRTSFYLALKDLLQSERKESAFAQVSSQ